MRLGALGAALLLGALAGLGAGASEAAAATARTARIAAPASRPDLPGAPDAPGREERPVPRRADTLPIPVLLVPGWSDPEPVLAPLRARFVEAGWPPGRVATMGFRDPVGSNRDHAEEVAAEAEALRTATEVPEIDLVAHSMGGLAVRHHLAATGGRGVRRVVFLGTPHRGTVTAHLAWGAGAREMEPGSPFLDSLNAGPAVPEGVRALSVRTALDLRVVPGASALLPEAENTENVEVCCPTHPGLIDDRETFRVVVDFLRGDGEGGSFVPPPRGGRRGWRR